jgi:hypothetical protein
MYFRPSCVPIRSPVPRKTLYCGGTAVCDHGTSKTTGNSVP